MRIGEIVKVRFNDYPKGIRVKVGRLGFVCPDKSVNYTGVILRGKHKGRAIFFNENQIIQGGTHA